MPTEAEMAGFPAATARNAAKKRMGIAKPNLQDYGSLLRGGQTTERLWDDGKTYRKPTGRLQENIRDYRKPTDIFGKIGTAPKTLYRNERKPEAGARTFCGPPNWWFSFAFLALNHQRGTLQLESTTRVLHGSSAAWAPF